MFTKKGKFILILVVGALAWFSFHSGSWWGSRFTSALWGPSHVPVIYKLPEKDLPKPPPDKRSLWWKMGHRQARVDTEYIYEYPEEEIPEWFETRWYCFDFERFSNGSGYFWIKRENKVKKVPFVNLPTSFRMQTTTTEKGYELSYDRIRFDWLKWKKLEVGGRMFIGGETFIYARTRLEIWRFSVSGGYSNKGFYGEGNVTIW